MGRKPVSGICRLCGVNGKLSWEHVPPKRAYNSQNVLRANVEVLMSSEPWDGKRGRTIQGGAGDYTLCERCNNDTGSWYASEYVRWAKQGLERLAGVPTGRTVEISARFEGYPLRFLKQAVTMCCSVNGEEFPDRNPELRGFLLDPHNQRLPNSYGVDVVLLRGGFARSAGSYGKHSFDRGGDGLEIASEIAHFPFGITLLQNRPVEPRRRSIEHFRHYGYDERREVWIQTIVGDVTTKFPGDYRSPEEVLAQRVSTESTTS